MAKLIYPIVLHPEEAGGYSVDVPDLGIGTQGENVAECIEMARTPLACGASASRMPDIPSQNRPTLCRHTNRTKL